MLEHWRAQRHEVAMHAVQMKEHLKGISSSLVLIDDIHLYVLKAEGPTAQHRRSDAMHESINKVCTCIGLDARQCIQCWHLKLARTQRMHYDCVWSTCHAAGCISRKAAMWNRAYKRCVDHRPQACEEVLLNVCVHACRICTCHTQSHNKPATNCTTWLLLTRCGMCLCRSRQKQRLPLMAYCNGRQY